VAEALAVRDLTVDLGRSGAARRVLGGVSLEVAPGEVVALVGESGSGKTTIGLAVQGLLPPGAVRRLEGSVRVGGGEVVGAAPRAPRRIRRRLVRMVPQDPMRALDPTMRVGRQLRGAGGTPEATAEALRRMGLADPERVAASYPRRLSGGQRQRVGMARAVVDPPAVRLCDEPIGAMDVSLAARILNLPGELRRRIGLGVLFATHDLGVAANLAGDGARQIIRGA
jgi:peptide/nickel transport system ATP-binding protein